MSQSGGCGPSLAWENENVRRERRQIGGDLASVAALMHNVGATIEMVGDYSLGVSESRTGVDLGEAVYSALRAARELLRKAEAAAEAIEVELKSGHYCAREA